MEMHMRFPAKDSQREPSKEWKKREFEKPVNENHRHAATTL